MAPKRPSEDSTSASASAAKRARRLVPAAPYPGGPMEIVFSFDTTGSMSSCLNSVRDNIQEMITRLFTDMPQLRIAVIAHGDYEDARCKNCYVTKMHDFSSSVDDLCEFVKTVGSTCGFDSDECYELVLKEVTEMSWSPGSQRSLVTIGDANPHELRYFDTCKVTPKPQAIDWREQTDILRDMGVHIYGVECQAGSTPKTFYTEIAKRTDGTYIKLNNFSNVYDMLMAICYRENGPDMLSAYEHEVRGRGTIHPEMDRMFSALRTKSATTADASAAAPETTAITKKKTKTSAVVKAKKASAAKKLKAIIPKQKNLARPLSSRQIVSYNKFISRDEKEKLPNGVCWSKWKKCMSPSSDDCITRPRPDGVGWKLPVLFGRLRRPQFCVYEFAVRLPVSSTLYVTYISAVLQKGSMPNWENVLFRAQHLRDQITDVLGQGCDIFVRRAIMRNSLKPVAELRKMRDIFASVNDYAWCKIACGRRLHKTVIRRGFVISDSLI
ncbi:uncharacterized protein LOC141899580 [Tubulanus polymorphus]|uniref:uncharacterized protein LOC141899580 n=1 Tax=Tubulanus polymorphus TaxID=672921 RepID=UPI003DA54C35